jgi:hypothetical protein
VVVLCVDYIVGEFELFIVFIFKMKRNHCTVELKKKKCPILLHSGVTGSMKLILGSGRKKKGENVYGTEDDAL